MSKSFYLPFLLGATILCAQAPVVQRLTIEDGLSQGMIYDLLQSSKGFLWIATKDGLNRYDGYNFKVYSHDPFNPYSIAENTVTALFEDSRGWLWVGLESKGVDVYNPGTGRFHHFSLGFGDDEIWAGSSIINILETNDGAIWAGKNGGSLLRIEIPEDWENGLPDQPGLQALAAISHIPFSPTISAAKKKLPLLISLSLQADGELLLTAFDGQYIVDPKTLTSRPVHKNLLAPTITRAAIGNVWEDGDVWVLHMDEASKSNELRRIRKGTVKKYPFPYSPGNWPRLAPGQKGHVWYMMAREMWDIAPGQDIDFSMPEIALDAPPNCLTYDRNGNLWIGTLGYGLRKINPMQRLFHAGAKGTSFRGLWANRGRYFVRSFSKIHLYDPKTDQISSWPAFPDAPERQINLTFEPSGAIWLLCTESEYTRGMLRHYPPGTTEKADAVYEFPASLNLFDPMLLDGKGRLWIAVSKGKLACFKPASGQFDYFDFGQLFGEKLNAVRAMAIAQDGNGTIWIGTQMGLVKCTPNKGNGQGMDFQLIQADPAKRQGINNNSITCLLPDPSMPESILWVGTKGGGINRMDIRSGYCQHITTEDGLLNDVIYGILPGNRNEKTEAPCELWCSTNRGLAKIIAQANDQQEIKAGGIEITTFTAALGLQDNEFNTYAYCKSDNGELLFGGVNGLNRFFPEELKSDTARPSVYIVGLEINHKKAGLGNPLPQPLETLGELRLNYDQNNISFEFAALDFTDPSKNRYRYQLVGLDKHWVETGNHRFAHFNHLPPGRYTFKVQGSNGESAWADAANQMTLVVLPPWWHTKLAYACYILLIAGASWWLYRMQIQRVKEREQLAFEQREAQRAKAVEEMKTNFFNNVTHEFRTPLTLIIEPLRQLLQNPNDPDRQEKTRLAEKNSRHLLGLVNQLLDLAKLEGGNMALDLRRNDLYQTVREVFESFLPLAYKRNIKLSLARPAESPFFVFDKSKVELVINNLLSNALKFTPEGGQIQLEIKKPASGSVVTQPDAEPHISLVVRDTGIGIPAHEQGKIFNRFYQVSMDEKELNLGGNKGSGIGLALSKELALLMGGGISVESEIGKGSTFTFWLPIRQAEGVAMAPALAAPLNESGPVESPPNGARKEGRMVLLVEDNYELRSFIRQSMNGQWQVVEASNGEEGLKKATELLPDLVISDVMMPQKDGYTLCQELKANELTAHLPIILLTAKSAVESKIKGLQYGADDYLVKPFNTDEMLARMENLVESRRKLQLQFGARSVSDSFSQLPKHLAKPDQEFIRKFQNLLELHLSDDQIGVEDFARKMFVSRSQLHRKLKAITGRNATDFIRDYRLERAHSMLLNREGLVSEIAQAVGFGNDKYFSTVFKQKYGVPPSQVG